MGVFSRPLTMFTDACRFFPWEVARAHRTLQHQLLECFRQAKAIEAYLPLGADFSGVFDVPNWRTSDDARLLRFTPLVPFVDQPPTMTLEYVMAHETISRETLVAFAFQIWRLEMGDWPVGLHDLTTIRSNHDRGPLLKESSIRDPANGELFRYRGRLPPGIPATGVTIIVASVGHNHLRVSTSPACEYSLRGSRRTRPEWLGEPKWRRNDQDQRCRLDFINGKLMLRPPFTQFPSDGSAVNR